MPTTTKTIDPKKNLTSFAGIPLTSYAKGTFIKIEADEDAFKKEVGASGETVRVLSNNRGAKVTVTLMAQSADNDALSAIHAQDRLTGEGVGVFQTKEINGSSYVIGEGWIQKTPDYERADEATSVEWVFDLADASIFLGGLS
jgi:hypothetical protein